MPLIYCKLPLLRVNFSSVCASNQEQWHYTELRTVNCASTPSNVRLMRRPKEADSTRFVLSGKLGDVCAALDQLAAQESLNALRMARV